MWKKFLLATVLKPILKKLWADYRDDILAYIEVLDAWLGSKVK